MILMPHLAEEFQGLFAKLFQEKQAEYTVVTEAEVIYVF